MNFTKMHGLGNDYIFLNCMEAVPDNLDELARRLSDRHFGIGGDGIICVCPSQRADFKMRIFNADGSEGAMCGNGIRCFGKYVYDKGLTDKAHLTVETLSGNRELSLTMEDRRVTGAVVGMGIPDLQQPAEIAVKGMTYTANLVSMGNPHAVIEVEDPAALDLQAVGPAVERHPSAGPGRDANARLGAGQWRNHGLRHRGVRVRRGYDGRGEAGPGCQGPAGRGGPAGPLGRKIRPNVYDRACQYRF